MHLSKSDLWDWFYEWISAHQIVSSSMFPTHQAITYWEQEWLRIMLGQEPAHDLVNSTFSDIDEAENQIVNW